MSSPPVPRPFPVPGGAPRVAAGPERTPETPVPVGEPASTVPPAPGSSPPNPAAGPVPAGSKTPAPGARNPASPATLGIAEAIPPGLTIGPADFYALVGTALDLRGSPYRDGGSDPRGFDCSGFTQYVFARHGVAIPRATRDQFKLGKTVDSEALEPGDLLFFTTTTPGASHVGIAVGTDQFVHAPSSTGVVRVERLTSGYWSQRFIGAKRIALDESPDIATSGR